MDEVFSVCMVSKATSFARANGVLEEGISSITSPDKWYI
jgi:hypothetical protein